MLTEKQRLQRKNGIGGSDAAAVLNIQPLDIKRKQYKTAMQVWLEKTGRIESLDLSHIEPVIWGNLLEDDIITRYEMKTGYKVRLLGRTLKHKKYPWMLANLDGIVINEGKLIEAKTAEYSKEWGRGGTNNIPLEYIIQVQHCLAVLGSHEKYSHIIEADIPTMFSKRDFRIFNVKKDDDLINFIIDKEKEFWDNCVKADIPPQPSNKEDTCFIWPNDNGEIIETKEKDAEIELENYKKIKIDLNKLEKMKQEMEAKITSRIGEASGIRIKNDLITFKKFKSTRVLRLYERE